MNHSQQQYQKAQYMRGFQMPPEPESISSTNVGATKHNPATHRVAVLMSPSMVTAIKNSRKGTIPPSITKHLNGKKGGK